MATGAKSCLLDSTCGVAQLHKAGFGHGNTEPWLPLLGRGYGVSLQGRGTGYDPEKGLATSEYVTLKSFVIADFQAERCGFEVEFGSLPGALVGLALYLIVKLAGAMG